MSRDLVSKLVPIKNIDWFSTEITPSLAAEQTKAIAELTDADVRQVSVVKYAAHEYEPRT